MFVVYVVVVGIFCLYIVNSVNIMLYGFDMLFLIFCVCYVIFDMIFIVYRVVNVVFVNFCVLYVCSIV